MKMPYHRGARRAIDQFREAKVTFRLQSQLLQRPNPPYLIGLIASYLLTLGAPFSNIRLPVGRPNR